jgi:phosphoribosylaminoimidazole-succinocarboxamide synthase
VVAPDERGAGAGPRHAGQAAAAPADRSRGARLPGGLGLEGIPRQRFRLRRALPPGLALASRLPQPIFTPATKAEAGAHDENISFEQTVALIGADRAAQVRDVALRLYTEAAAYALTRGIVIADTKFEFGLDEHGTLTLMDEVLTPDSSRFWPLASWREGENPPSYDKQYLRDWLEAPAPRR